MHNRPNVAYLRRYVRGELSPQEMYEIEKAAEADELLMDIILGLEAEYAHGGSEHVVLELQQQIQDRSQPQPRQIRSFSYRWIGLAASLLLVFGMGMYVFLKSESAEQQIVQQTAPPTSLEPVNALPPSSTDSSTIASANTPAKPSRNNGKIVAYSNVEAPALKRQHNTVAARRAALDTIPIQIVPSNKEELISLVLGDDQLTLTARSDATTPAKTRARTARMLTNKQKQSKSNESFFAQNLKSITTGIVIDSETQRPIAGATIRDQQMNTMVKTDSTGRFIVGSTDEKPILSIQSDGFESSDRVANGAMRIALNRMQNSKTMAPATASSVAEKLGNARPAMGSNAYRLHLDSLAKASGLGTGSVTLLFTINAQGRPINIRLKKSSGDRRQDQEAIKILKDGPDWIKGSTDELVDWRVQF